MMQKIALKTLLASLAILATSACGPVNTKPETSPALAQSMNNSNPTEGGLISNKKSFLIAAVLKSPNGIHGKAQLGDNQYVLRFVRASDLSPVSRQAKLQVTYEHLHSKVQKSYAANTEEQPDGTFVVTLHTKRHGAWILHLTLSDVDGDNHGLVEDTVDLPLSI